MERAFERIKPGEDPPPPPPELLQWARETTYGLCGGIVYGAASAHYAERRRVVESMESATKRKHRIWTRTISDVTLHGMRLGSFVSVFSAARLGLEKRRDARDMWNVVGAGMLTSALTGMAIPGGVAVRARGAALGVVVGGAATLPFGYAMQELEKLVPELVAPAAAAAMSEGESRKLDVTEMFIEQVEAELEEYRREERKRRRGWFWKS